jgi:four helix bundle protein
LLYVQSEFRITDSSAKISPPVLASSLMIDCAMAESIICNRAFQFAVRIVKLCERMAESGFGARHIAKQLIRCGTSIGANAEEAQEGQSKADYIAKMSVSSKEARETGYWLRLAIAVSCVSDVDWELKEANELRFMIRAAIHTGRSSPSRGRDT